MNRHQSNDLAYYTFDALDAFGELIHAVTTRHGGVSAGQWSSLNLTKGTGDDPAAVEENLRRACGALGLCREDLVSPNQRHTANVRRVGAGDRGRIWPNIDTLITDEPGVPLLLRYADCTPVLIYDPVRRALALVHSGWRGTVQAAANREKPIRGSPSGGASTRPSPGDRSPAPPESAGHGTPPWRETPQRPGAEPPDHASTRAGS